MSAMTNVTSPLTIAVVGLALLVLFIVLLYLRNGPKPAPEVVCRQCGVKGEVTQRKQYAGDGMQLPITRLTCGNCGVTYNV